MNCKSCGGSNKPDSVRCRYCGNWFEVETHSSPKSEGFSGEEFSRIVEESLEPKPVKKRSTIDILSRSIYRMNRLAPRILLDESYPFGTRRRTGGSN